MSDSGFVEKAKLSAIELALMYPCVVKPIPGTSDMDVVNLIKFQRTIQERVVELDTLRTEAKCLEQRGKIPEDSRDTLVKIFTHLDQQQKELEEALQELEQLCTPYHPRRTETS